MHTTAISHLFNPRSIAIVGASNDPHKTAGRPLAYLQKHGYPGVIFPVNPKAEHIAGLPCHASVDALPQTPDVGIVLLGAEHALHAVQSLAARGTRAAIVLAGGYAEAGPQGRARQQALVDAAGDMRLLGPNTIGLVNVTDHVTLSASSALEVDALIPGAIAVVSQSGGILGSLLSRGAARGIGFSKLVSTSNEADLEMADFIEALAGDAATRVIALYMEGIRHPEHFRRAARRAAEAGKPVVAFKVGRSASGAAAVTSHTGALAGSDRMYDAFFQEVGIIRAQTFADLLDLPAALSTGRRLHGRRVAVLTSTGGAGTLVADSLGVAGFETPAPDAESVAQLRALQGNSPAILDRSPIDVTLAGLQPQLLRGAIHALLQSPGYDAVAVIIGSSALTQPDLMTNAIQDCLHQSDKPILAYVSPHAPEVSRQLNHRGIPAFDAPQTCASALAAMLAASQARHAVDDGRDVDVAHAQPVLTDLRALPAGPLDEAQAKALFSRFGIRSVMERQASNAAGAQTEAEALGDRVVLKILSRAIPHKTEVGGVAVAVPSRDVRTRAEHMRQDVIRQTGIVPDGFLVQEVVTGGVEMILGLQRDPLGTAVLLGMGGITAELIQDTVLRMVPREGTLTRAQAHAMIQALNTWPLLTGYRGRPEADVDALADAIVGFSRLAGHAQDRLETAEINPLFVLPKGQGVLAADGVAVLR